MANPDLRSVSWLLSMLAGAVAGAAVQVVELATVRRAVDSPDALLAMGLSVALAGCAQLFLVRIALWLSRRRARQEAWGDRWSVGSAVFIGLAMVGSGAAIHVGMGVRGGLRTLIVSWLVWCLVAALASVRLAEWMVSPQQRRADRERRCRTAASALVALLVLAWVVSLVRSGSWLLVAAAMALGAGGVVLARRVSSRVAGTAALALVAVAAALPWWAVMPVRTERTDPPAGSIVLIILDTTRADVFGAYGATTGETPVFDRLADEGLLFEEMISHSPWTVPSHATFFTGLPPRQHDCWSGGRRWLEDEFETLAERLSTRGYDTAAFYANINLAEANLLQGFALQEFLPSPAAELSLGWLARATGIGPGEWIDRGASRVVRRIRTWLAERESRRPFFLFVNLLEAHDPYLSPFREHQPPPGVSELESLTTMMSFQPPVWFSLARDRGRDAEIVRAAYRASIRYQDRQLGRLLDTLGERYALDQLPIVVSSDHGENLGDGGRWEHQFALNDALIRLPFVIRAPARLKSRGRVRGSFASDDLPATLLDLAGVGQHYGRGRSLLGERGGEEVTFAEVYPFYLTLHKLERDHRTDLGDFRWPLSAVRGEGHKLVVWHGGSTRLYDLERDPAESVDLLAQRPEIARRLAERLARWWVEVPWIHRTQGASEAPGRLDPDLAEQLRALGYL